MPVSTSNGATTISVFCLSVLFSIVVKPGARVRLVDEFDWVTNLHAHLAQLRAGADLHLATRIARDDYVRFRRFDGVEFFFQHLSRQLGLEHVVDAGRAATPFSAVELAEV